MTRLSFKTRLTSKMNSYHQLYSSNQLLYLIVSVEFSVHCNAKGVAVVGGKRIVRGKCISNLLLGINPNVSLVFHVFVFMLCYLQAMGTKDHGTVRRTKAFLPKSLL